MCAFEFNIYIDFEIKTTTTTLLLLLKKVMKKNLTIFMIIIFKINYSNFNENKIKINLIFEPNRTFEFVLIQIQSIYYFIPYSIYIATHTNTYAQDS